MDRGIREIPERCAAARHRRLKADSVFPSWLDGREKFRGAALWNFLQHDTIVPG
jgi:hypothetical protein